MITLCDKLSLSQSFAGGFSFSGIVPSICIRLGDCDKRLERTGWRHYAGADMKKHVVALYGNVALERGYCKSCQSMALIKNGKFACCDTPVNDTPSKFERQSEPLFARKTPSKHHKDRILEQQEHRCFYCGVAFDTYRYRDGLPVLIRVHWDHQLPFTYSQNNRTENFVAACQVCNGIKSSHLFQTVEEAQVYIAGRRKAKGYDF